MGPFRPLLEVSNFFGRKKSKGFRTSGKKQKLCDPAFIEATFERNISGITSLPKGPFGYDKRLPDGMGHLSTYHQKKRKPTKL